ncbi:MAG: biofilm-associated protein [Crenarchaeota archaeon]|nr:biofilm-associated protein [Thermoproteota archaeon]MDA1123716.1 biofilm-associated protein [Thermoproteota archaeon]
MSPIRVISILTIVLCSLVLILIPSNVYAQELDVKSIGLDETSLITLTNNSSEDVKTFRIWLQEDFNFKSFKTEKGWIGEKNPQGVIIFTSSESIKMGQSVKFGIKADKQNAIINWKGLNQNNEVIKTGLVKSDNLPIVTQNQIINEKFENTGNTILLESTFKVIPDKPNPGSTIRLVGENFGESQKFSFYIDAQKITDFATDENGEFITTGVIPNLEKEQRVDFKIIGYDQAETKISIKLGNGDNRISETENIKLTMEEIDNSIKIGEILNINGKGTAGKSVIVKIVNSEKNTIITKTTQIDSTGNWEFLDSITIPFDAVLGEYSILLEDGNYNVLKKIDVVTNKIILINPTKIMFESGELMKFNGTAIPNSSLELILEDNLGNEKISDIIQVQSSGFIEFEYQSIENDDNEGTWTLIAIQKEVKEFIYVGHGQLPTTPLNMSFDKTNYQKTEYAVIEVIGNPLDKLTLIIITPSGAVKDESTIIELNNNGRGSHKLDLSSYSSGIYTAVMKKNNLQSNERFSVGLQIGSGQINAQTTQDQYTFGERILLIGKSKPNMLMTGKLIDPDGIEIKKIEIISDMEGIFKEENFKIPTDAKTGSWKIEITSGSNLNKVQFEVVSTGQDGISIKAVKEKGKPGYQPNVKISIISSQKVPMFIEIINEQNELVEKMKCNTTKEFKCETFWSISKDTLPGMYTIKVYDPTNSSQIAFLLE